MKSPGEFKKEPRPLPGRDYSKDEEQDYLFSEETIASLAEFGEVLMKIHQRLISEGYEITEDGIHKTVDTTNKSRVQ